MMTLIIAISRQALWLILDFRWISSQKECLPYEQEATATSRRRVSRIQTVEWCRASTPILADMRPVPGHCDWVVAQSLAISFSVE